MMAECKRIHVRGMKVSVRDGRQEARDDAPVRRGGESKDGLQTDTRRSQNIKGERLIGGVKGVTRGCGG